MESLFRYSESRIVRSFDSFDESDIQEGFICPECKIDLKRASKLKSHFTKMHSGPNIDHTSVLMTIDHKFGVPNDKGKDILADPYLMKELLDLAGLEEDVLKIPEQKEEIEDFCKDNNVKSRLKRYLDFSENPEWQNDLPSSRWYFAIDEITTRNKVSQGLSRKESMSYPGSSRPKDNIAKSSKLNLNNYKRRSLTDAKGKPALPPKSNVPVVDKNGPKANRSRPLRRLKLRNANKSSEPKPLTTKSCGVPPPAPPLPNHLSHHNNSSLKKEPLKNKSDIKELNLKENELKRTIHSKEMKSTSGNQNDLRGALLGVLEKLNKDKRVSDYYSLSDTDTSSDEEWAD